MLSEGDRSKSKEKLHQEDSELKHNRSKEYIQNIKKIRKEEEEKSNSTPFNPFSNYFLIGRMITAFLPSPSFASWFKAQNQKNVIKVEGSSKHSDKSEEKDAKSKYFLIFKIFLSFSDV